MLLLGIAIFISHSLYAADCSGTVEPTPAVTAYFETQLSDLLKQSKNFDIRDNFEAIKKYAQDRCYPFTSAQQQKVSLLEADVQLQDILQNFEKYRYGAPSPQDSLIKNNLIQKIRVLREKSTSPIRSVLLAAEENFLANFKKSNISSTSESLCATKDLRSKFGPVESQGDFGNCYAYACAALLGFYLPEGGKVSVNDISILVAQDRAIKGGKPFSLGLAKGGECSEVASILKIRGGVCVYKKEELSKSIPSNDPCGYTSKSALGVGLQNSSIADLIKFYTGKPEEQQLLVEDSRQCEKSRIPLSALSKLATYEAAMPPAATKIFGELNKSFAKEMAKVDLEASGGDLPIGYADNSLANSLMTMIRPADSLLPKIRAQLDKDQPIGISLYVSSFLSPNSDGNHAMVIVGRSWNNDTKECEYLVRNSWGNSKSDFIKFTQQSGNIKIPEKALLSGLQDIQIVE